MLPPEWAAANNLQLLARLNLSSNEFTGSVPAQWLEPGAFPEMTALWVLSFFPSFGCGSFLPGTSRPHAALSALAHCSLPPSYTPRPIYLVLCVLLHNTSRTVLHPAYLASCTVRSVVLCKSSVPVQLPALREGAAAAAVSALAHLSLGCCSCRDVANNQISGVLDEGWADVQVLPELKILSLAGNNLSDTLPDTWGGAAAFPVSPLLIFLPVCQDMCPAGCPAEDDTCMPADLLVMASELLPSCRCSAVSTGCRRV